MILSVDPLRLSPAVTRTVTGRGATAAATVTVRGILVRPRGMPRRQQGPATAAPDRCRSPRCIRGGGNAAAAAAAGHCGGGPGGLRLRLPTSGPAEAACGGPGPRSGSSYCHSGRGWPGTRARPSRRAAVAAARAHRPGRRRGLSVTVTAAVQVSEILSCQCRSYESAGAAGAAGAGRGRRRVRV